ncbi:MAG: response regulator [Candidatus Omnitrophota bacterium]|nr:MAG: response regulator [Candidatus Omnitrophota bacterium]
MGKKKILIVDDELSFGQILKLNLEKTGKYKVKIETRGTHALDAARKFAPDVVLLDIVMPDLDGAAIACQMERDENLKSIPLVFLTAAVTEEDAAAQYDIIGGRPFIPKPVTTAELVDFIEKTLPKKE